MSTGTLRSLILCGFATQLLLALFVVPPWQNPDEPQHLITVRLVNRHGAGFDVDRDRDPEGEQAIVASMARNNWWEHYGRERPDPVPATFVAGPGVVVDEYFGPPGDGSRLYYRAMAVLMRIVRTNSPLRQMYAMRIVSALLALLALWYAWDGTALWLGDRAAAVVTASIALHPQFVLMSTTAGPDAAVALAGTVFWWQAARVWRHADSPAAMALMWSAVVIGFLMRRVGAPLLLVAGAVTVAVTARAVWARRANRPSPRVVMVLAAAAVSGLAILLLAGQDALSAARWSRLDVGRAVPLVMQRLDQLPRFLLALFNTFWLSAGWVRYPPPEWWHWVTIIVSVAAVAGLLFRRATPADRPAVWLAAGAVVAQVGAIVLYHFGILDAGPQGRYFFPLMPAIVSLLWVGWRGCFGVTREHAAAAALVTIAFVLNITAWIVVLLPVYA